MHNMYYNLYINNRVMVCFAALCFWLFSLSEHLLVFFVEQGSSQTPHRIKQLSMMADGAIACQTRVRRLPGPEH
jgi:hypothetical protein